MKIVEKIVKFETTHSKEWDENVQEIIDSLPKAKKFIFIWQEHDMPMYGFSHVSGGTRKGDFVFVGAWLQHLHLREIFDRQEEENYEDE